MNIDTNNMISITEVSQNFLKAVSLSDKTSSIYIMKNDKPKYLMIDLNSETL